MALIYTMVTFTRCTCNNTQYKIHSKNEAEISSIQLCCIVKNLHKINFTELQNIVTLKLFMNFRELVKSAVLAGRLFHKFTTLLQKQVANARLRGSVYAKRYCIAKCATK